MQSLTSRKWWGFLLLVLVTILTLWIVKPLFSQRGLRWVHVFVTSFLLSLLFVPLSQKAAFRWNILDRPGGHKIHEQSTPLLGGVSIFLGFFVSLTANSIFSVEFAVILLSALILFVLGVIDDVRSLPASLKLGVQILLSLVVTWYGVRVILIPEHLFIFKLANILISVFWIVGITNAVNFFDGMDGLAAGLGAIISFFMGIVALRMNVPMVGWACLAMLGACLGFLPFNFRPGKKATIFLGDAGSTVIGFVLGVLAIYSEWADLNPLISLVSPLLIFAILIFDMVYITFSRIYRGHVRTFRQWIDFVGHDHLHHRFSRVLGGPTQSVLFIYTLTICLGMNALLLPHLEIEGALILLGQSLLILSLVTILEKKSREDERNMAGESCNSTDKPDQ